MFIEKTTAGKIYPIVEAIMNGKTVQYKDAISPHAEWFDINGIADLRTLISFPERYRIKPEPRLRAWTTEEVPIGARLRTKELPMVVHLILAAKTVGNNGYLRVAEDVGIRDYQLDKYVLERCEHSTDNGKTWLPCGVEVYE